MKNLTFVLLAAILAFSFRSDKPIKVIFFGDSITQAGVSEKGYITQLGKMLEKAGKASNFELIGAGIGGNKVYDLFLRLEDDVLLKKPDIVFIYVGVNDVWHKASYGTGTDADKFEKFYKALVSKMQAQNIKVIVCTPAAIGERTDNSNSQDGDLNQYSKIIRKIAIEKNCGLVDLRKAFLEYNIANNPNNDEKGVLTTDRVHLNEKGNILVAELMVKNLPN
jgi:lysophospholipase L1-like esterase